jgi:hypothetical protein
MYIVCNCHGPISSWKARSIGTPEHLQHEKSVCQVTWGSQPPLSVVIGSDGTWVRSLVVVERRSTCITRWNT